MDVFSLIVEDDEDLAEIFSQALIAADYKTEIINDGLVAHERLQQVVPDVVILDMHLPNMAGDKLLDQIRGDARLEKTRVVVATADAQMGERMRNLADLVLIKPVSFTQLRDLSARLRPQQ
ncbi:MAG: response regulator [Anaerolineaceae bacterium]|jgi:CheY-like chemotaxis protein|nr:MAG: response regulator [Anaerolineaceae bacterium]